MTDTKTPSPSDAELLEVAGLAPNRKVCASTCMASRFDKNPCECYPGMRKGEAIKFARAVLARWGAQPAPVREPTDTERLNYMQAHPEKSIRYHKGKWAFIGFTNYEFDLHSSLRAAIDASARE